ncbi:hypothetical protein EVA_04649 [gut metagenome]|uniref:Uncharacterized protein n=1 Tax=gut metagenome TaxID=749906 RepID=J9D3K9_9ZZZZ
MWKASSCGAVLLFQDTAVTVSVGIASNCSPPVRIFSFCTSIWLMPKVKRQSASKTPSRIISLFGTTHSSVPSFRKFRICIKSTAFLIHCMTLSSPVDYNGHADAHIHQREQTNHHHLEHGGSGFADSKIIIAQRLRTDGHCLALAHQCRQCVHGKIGICTGRISIVKLI